MVALLSLAALLRFVMTPSKIAWALYDPPRQLSGEDIKLRNGTLPVIGFRAPQKWCFIHIPKTAGDAFMAVAAQVMPVGTTLQGNGEAAVHATMEIIKWQYNHFGGPGSKLAVFLRHPEDHVLSQFLERKYDLWGRLVTAESQFPRNNSHDPYDGYAQWIRHFADMEPNAAPDGSKRQWAWAYKKKKKPCLSSSSKPYTPYEVCKHKGAWVEMFDCYNPWNMQARLLSSEESGELHGAGLTGLTPSLEKAENVLRSMAFFGIQDLWKESLCLFRYTTTGSLPDSCSCNGTGAVQNMPSRQNMSHNVPAHHRGAVGADVRKEVRKLVQVDAELYFWAQSLFQTRLRTAEAATGVKIACPGSLERIQRASERLRRFSKR